MLPIRKIFASTNRLCSVVRTSLLFKLPTLFAYILFVCSILRAHGLDSFVEKNALTASCLFAPISIDIAPTAPWPLILYLSRPVRDPRRGGLQQRLRPLRFIAHRGGPLQLIDHIAQLFLCLISSRCNDWLRPIHTSTSWLPPSLEIFLHRHMKACSRHSR